jgi:hypothetical protein
MGEKRLQTSFCGDHSDALKQMLSAFKNSIPADDEVDPFPFKGSYGTRPFSSGAPAKPGPRPAGTRSQAVAIQDFWKDF